MTSLVLCMYKFGVLVEGLERSRKFISQNVEFLGASSD